MVLDFLLFPVLFQDKNASATGYGFRAHKYDFAVNVSFITNDGCVGNDNGFVKKRRWF